MRTLNWGLIGCGDISRKRVAPALRDLPHCEFGAVSRAQAHLAEAFAREFGAARWYADWRALLLDESIEAVYLATPVALHAEQTIAAAAAGKHVLCEKPMALNVNDCERMIEACQQHNVQLGIAYYRHHYPVIQRVKALLASGELGQPVLAQINAFERFDPAPDHPRHWFVKKAVAGGGPMMDFGCHRIEVLQNILGPIAQTVSSLGNVHFKNREVEDTAVALFDFASGARGVLSVTHAALESQDTLDIFCTSGSLHIANLNQGELRILTAQGTRHETHSPHVNIHLPLLEAFTTAVLKGEPPPVGGSIGLAVAQVEANIYAST